MAKSISSIVVNAALSYIKENVTKLLVCSEQPTTVAMAVSTEMLASYAIASTEFTLADGDVSGRKVTVGSAVSFAVSNTGSAQHVALVDGGNSVLLVVTTCTNQTLTAGNTLTVPAWDYEITNPT